MTPRQLAVLASADYVERIYQEYLRDPASVDAEWARYFSDLGSEAGVPAAGPVPAAPDDGAGTRVLGIFGLINTYRENGHLIANLDPLGHNKAHHPLLELSEINIE